jgi:predicted esterase
MNEHHVSVTRTARYYTVPAEEGPREVWIVLHGYGQLAGPFLRSFQALDDGRRLFVAPEALSRFYVGRPHDQVGASWMTREDREAEIYDYVTYLDAVYDRVFTDLDRDQVTVHLLGFSQGTATASRWAALGRARFDRLLLWGGSLAHDLDLDRHAPTLAGLGLTLVYGLQDQWITAAHVAALEDTLARHTIPYRLVPFDGGHDLDDDVLRSLVEP